MKTKLLSFILIICCSLFLVTSVLAIEGFSEKIGQGQVDWENGIITVTGEGAPPEGATKTNAPLLAKRAAIMDAYRNAVEVINGIRIHSNSYVKDLTLQSDEISGSVQGFIKGGQFEKPVYDSEGRCTIILHLPVGGHKGLTSIINEPSEPMVQDTPISQNDGATTGEMPTDTTYTGIIIDARNFGVRPALYPQIFDSEGFLVFGQAMVNLSDPGFTTIVAYSKTLDKAKSLTRVGNKPLIIKATGGVKSANGETTDLVISSEDSKLIRSLANKNDLLSKAAVVVVIN